MDGTERLTSSIWFLNQRSKASEGKKGQKSENQNKKQSGTTEPQGRK